MRRSGRGVRFQQPVESKPELGIAYLRYLTTQPWCRNMLLQKHRDELITLLTLMRDVMVRLITLPVSYTHLTLPTILLV